MILDWQHSLAQTFDLLLAEWKPLQCQPPVPDHHWLDRHSR